MKCPICQRQMDHYHQLKQYTCHYCDYTHLPLGENTMHNKDIEQPQPDYDGQFTRVDAIVDIRAMHEIMGTTMTIINSHTDEEVMIYHEHLCEEYEMYQANQG